jgi:hypothetical protein
LDLFSSSFNISHHLLQLIEITDTISKWHTINNSSSTRANKASSSPMAMATACSKGLHLKDCSSNNHKASHNLNLVRRVGLQLLLPSKVELKAALVASQGTQKPLSGKSIFHNTTRLLAVPPDLPL